MTITTIPETQLPDGLHHPAAVETLARMAGWDGEELPHRLYFGAKSGFSERTMFILSSKGDGYYQTSLDGGCTCPDFRLRKAGTGQFCKHQKILAEHLAAKVTRPAASLPKGVIPMTEAQIEERKARIAERNRRRAEERTISMGPRTLGFNCPDELARAPI
jgi:hypothetical protein